MAQQFDQSDTALASSQAAEDGVPVDTDAKEESAVGAGVERSGVGTLGSPSLTRKHVDPSSPARRSGVDWLALSITVLIAAIFAIAGRLYGQPTTSLVPVAVMSASGCGLLITALRKLRARKGVGLLEAAIAGFSVAVLQFLAALSYPGVIPSLGNEQLAGPGFFTTWGLVAFFSALFAVIGATLGHLAFAPLRPLPAGKVRKQPGRQEKAAPQKQTGMSYAITVLMLGLIPVLAGYVFSAAFDFALSHNGYAPGPFPTLRLLSTLLPWQVPDPVGLQGINSIAFIDTLLWRIPLFFGNPAPFDAQALEPLVFTAAGLALLLMTSLKQENPQHTTRQLWSRLLILEALLGLVLVLPAAIWMMQGLQGILQFHSLVVPLGTLRLLDAPTLVLNLFTGPLVCITIGALVSSRVKRG